MEARRKGRGRDGEQAARKEQGKTVCFREVEQSEKAREQSTVEEDVTSGLEEVRTGRRSAGLVRWREKTGVGRTRPAGKAKEEVTGVKENVETKEDLAAKEHSRTRGR